LLEERGGWHFLQGAEAGNPEAQFNLGLLLMERTKTLLMAEEWLRCAAALGIQQAQDKLVENEEMFKQARSDPRVQKPPVRSKQTTRKNPMIESGNAISKSNQQTGCGIVRCSSTNSKMGKKYQTMRAGMNKAVLPTLCSRTCSASSLTFPTCSSDSVSKTIPPTNGVIAKKRTGQPKGTCKTITLADGTSVKVVAGPVLASGQQIWRVPYGERKGETFIQD